LLDRLDEESDERVKALGEIKKDKLRVARAYNKKSQGEIISGQRPHFENDFTYQVQK
jgi:hypothetical protein